MDKWVFQRSWELLRIIFWFFFWRFLEPIFLTQKNLKIRSFSMQSVMFTIQGKLRDWFILFESWILAATEKSPWVTLVNFPWYFWARFLVRGTRGPVRFSRTRLASTLAQFTTKWKWRAMDSKARWNTPGVDELLQWRITDRRSTKVQKERGES